MKEKLYTIPLNDAVNANDECVFCNIERSLERDAIDFAIGSCASYMESDIRETTDKQGFCRPHLKMMYDYGNALGNGLIMKTHYKKMHEDLMKAFKSAKAPGRKKHNSVSEYVSNLESGCFVCKYYEDTYARYYDTFFYLYKKDSEFKTKIENSKGFCIHHLGELMEKAEKEFGKKELEEFYQVLSELTETNNERIIEDITWFCDKFDYRYKDADWKNSKDALPRTMQKLRGGYPADDPYKAK